MGFDVGAALLGGGDFLGSLFGVGAAEAAPVAGDVFAAGAGDALAGGLEGVGLGTAGFGALGAAGGETGAALGSGALIGDVGAGVGLGTAGLGALGGAGGFGAAADLGALGSSGLDLTGVGLGFAPPATGVADAASSLGGVGGTPFGGTTLPNVQPAGLGGGPAAPTVGAADVSQLTNQDLAAFESKDVTGTAADTAGAAKPPSWPLTGTQGVTPGANFAPGVTTGTTPGLGGAGAGAGGGGGGGAAGGGGWGTKEWMQAAGLGLAAAPLALTLARGEPSLPAQSGAAQGLYGAEGAAGQQLLQSALTNQPTPGQQAQLDAARQAYINAQRQALYNQGIQNPEASSAWGGIVGQANQQYQQQLQGYIAQNMNAALAATGGAAGGLTQLANQQIALDTAYQNAIAGAGRSLGGVVGQAGLRSLYA